MCEQNTIYCRLCSPCETHKFHIPPSLFMAFSCFFFASFFHSFFFYLFGHVSSLTFQRLFLFPYPTSSSSMNSVFHSLIRQLLSFFITFCKQAKEMTFFMVILYPCCNAIIFLSLSFPAFILPYLLGFLHCPCLFRFCS